MGFGLPAQLLAGSDVSTELAPGDLDPNWKKQSWWQALVDNSVEGLWSSVAPLRLKKVKELAMARRSTDVSSLVVAQPGEPGLSSRAWMLSVRYRLGMALDSGTSLECPGCSATMDSYGDHALCCHSLGIYGRHNDVRNQVAFLCNDLGLRVEFEKGPPGSLARPADLLIDGLDGAMPTAVDFSIVHALQLSSSLADVHVGKLAKQTERRKVQENGAACRRMGWICSPFVLEVFGAWGGKANRLMQQIIRLWTAKK